MKTDKKRIKADDPTKIARIRTVQEWLMLGNSTRDIVLQGRTSWGVCDRQVHRYIRDAKKAFSEDLKDKIDERRIFHIQARMRLYRNLKNKESAGGTLAAMAILKDIADIEGLYVMKHEHSGKDGQPIVTEVKRTVVFKKYDGSEPKQDGKA